MGISSPHPGAEHSATGHATGQAAAGGGGVHGSTRSGPAPPPRIISEQPLDWMQPATLNAVREALAARKAYPDATPRTSTAAAGEIEVRQTHISTVFLTPGHVFKFKRPVDVGFADFRTLDARKRFCEAEVTLNRRLARDVYLDVLPLWRQGDGFSLQHGEDVADYCVVMIRLPDERMLDHRLRHGGSLDAGEIDAIAGLLAGFHQAAGRDNALARFGGPEMIRRNWEENFRQTEPFIDQTISAGAHRTVREAVADFMARNAALIQERAAGGFIRDGHGDLRCEHLCLHGEGDIRIIDCIEFNDRFRYGDVANDLAFLLMDLTAHGHPDAALALMERYVALSGDAALPRLVAFYAAYRAFVRGKVVSFKLRDGNLTGEERDAARDRARRFFQLALDFAAQMAPPALVLISGLMGVGKSTLAAALSRRTGAAVWNSDAIRKALAGDAGAGADTPYGEGIYDEDWNARTYAALLGRAEEELAAGRSVILDASFSRERRRQEARELARRMGARAVLVECRLEEPALRERLRRRRAQGESLSDGREALLARQRAAFEPVPTGLPEAHLVVDMARHPDVLAEALAGRLQVPPPLFGLPRDVLS